MRDPIFLQLAIQSSLADAERSGGHKLIAIELMQSIQNGLLFQLSQRKYPGLLFRTHGAKRRRPDMRRKVRGLQHGPGTHGHGAFQAVFQFAHIARPLIKLSNFKASGLMEYCVCRV